MADNVNLSTDFPALQLVRAGRFIRLFSRLTFITLVIVIIAMIFAPWRQTARGTGVVIALDPQDRPQSVASPSEGVVSYVKPGLREGSYVEKGELLVKMEPFAEGGVSQLDMQIVATESELSAAESMLLILKQGTELQLSAGESLNRSLNQDYTAANKKWEQMKNELVALQAELDDKRNKMRIAEEVAAQGLVSREELFSKRQTVEIQRAKVLKAEGAVEEALATLLSKEEEIDSKKYDIDIKNQSANQKVLEQVQKVKIVEKKLIDLENKRDVFGRLPIKAPRSGHIQQLFAQEGSDTIKEGDQLFVIVPDADELAVEMRISDNDLPLIKEGDHVRLRFQGWPAVQFVGWPSVAIGTFGGKVNRVFPTDDGKGNFRIVVSPDHDNGDQNQWPDDRYLRQGVRANGWVLLNQVSLGYEIWRQINGFPPTISEKEPGSSSDKAGKVPLPKL